MESDFLALMPSVVLIEPFDKRDGFGKVHYKPPLVGSNLPRGAVAGTRCRIEEIVREVRTREGSTVSSGATVYPFDAPFSLTNDARITLPDGAQPPIVGIATEFDELGAHHIEIYLAQTAPMR